MQHKEKCKPVIIIENADELTQGIRDDVLSRFKQTNKDTDNIKNIRASVTDNASDTNSIKNTIISDAIKLDEITKNINSNTVEAEKKLGLLLEIHENSIKTQEQAITDESQITKIISDNEKLLKKVQFVVSDLTNITDEAVLQNSAIKKIYASSIKTFNLIAGNKNTGADWLYQSKAFLLDMNSYLEASNTYKEKAASQKELIIRIQSQFSTLYTDILLLYAGIKKDRQAAVQVKQDLNPLTKALEKMSGELSTLLDDFEKKYTAFESLVAELDNMDSILSSEIADINKKLSYFNTIETATSQLKTELLTITAKKNEAIKDKDKLSELDTENRTAIITLKLNVALANSKITKEYTDSGDEKKQTEKNIQSIEQSQTSIEKKYREALSKDVVLTELIKEITENNEYKNAGTKVKRLNTLGSTIENKQNTVLTEAEKTLDKTALASAKVEAVSAIKTRTDEDITRYNAALNSASSEITKDKNFIINYKSGFAASSKPITDTLAKLPELALHSEQLNIQYKSLEKRTTDIQKAISGLADKTVQINNKPIDSNIVLSYRGGKIGDIAVFNSGNKPSGYLQMKGQQITRSAYPDFFTALSITGDTYTLTAPSPPVYEYSQKKTVNLVGVTWNGIAVDSEKNVYIVSRNKYIIYDSAGTLKKTVNIVGDSGIAVDSEKNVYVLNSHGKYVIYDSAGTLKKTVRLRHGTWNGIAVDSERNVYIVSRSGKYVIYDSAGTLKKTVNLGDGYWYGIAVDSEKNVYVVDYHGKYVVYDSAGTLKKTVKLGDDKWYGIAVDSEKNVYVVDYNGKYVVYDSAGTLKKTVSIGKGVRYGIAVDSDRNVYVLGGKHFKKNNKYVIYGLSPIAFNWYQKVMN